MKYVIYCRKSTDTEDKQLLSLDAQERELREIATRNNLEVIETFRESMSAKNPGRPIFNEVIKLIQNKKVDGILCWKLDRLARNMLDGGLIIDMLTNGVIKEIRTHDSTHTPKDNVILLSVHFGSANQYSIDLSENVKRGNREKLSRGDWPCTAPLGYLNKNKSIIIDEERAKYIIKAFEMYTTGGYSLKNIADILHKDGFRSRGGKKVYRNQIERVLKNPFYCGLMKNKDKLYPGNHKAIISQEMFKLVSQVSQDKHRPRSIKLFFPLRGFLKCESCGCAFTASRKKGHDYYYCTNGKGICSEHKSYIREKDLYAMISSKLTELHFPQKLIDLMYRAAKERIDKNSSYLEGSINTLRKEVESLQAQESRLLDVFLQDNISKDIYDKKVLEIKNKIVQNKKQISELENRQPLFTLEPIKKVFEQGNISSKQFLEVEEEQKHEILKNLLWNLSIKDKNIVNLQYKNPFSILAKTSKNASFQMMCPQ